MLVTGPDQAALDRVLREAWAMMADDSPNRRADAGSLVIAKLSGEETAGPGPGPATDEERRNLEWARTRVDFRGLRRLLEQAADQAALAPMRT